MQGVADSAKRQRLCAQMALSIKMLELFVHKGGVKDISALPLRKGSDCLLLHFIKKTRVEDWVKLLSYALETLGFCPDGRRTGLPSPLQTALKASFVDSHTKPAVVKLFASSRG